MASVPRPGTILTGNSVSTSLTRYSFTAPNDLWIQEIINAILLKQSRVSAWTQGGAVTVDDAAEVFNQILWSLQVNANVGQILEFATVSLPGYCLPCDGASYLRSAYPDLYSAIGVSWGSVDGSHFNVPDMRGRAPIASGTGTGLSPRAIADNGGEETHQLTISELASHVHNFGGQILIGTQVPPPLDGLAPNPLLPNTSSAGGDQPHNNMQPFVVIHYGIVAQ